MYKKINSYFLIFIILFSMFPVKADAPIKYYEIDSDIELRGAIFVDVDPTGFYASLNNGIIQINSNNHYSDVMIKFKGIALNSRLKKYNGFNVGYTHISNNGIITNELKSLEIDYQGFAYLNTVFSTVIINGMTGTTTTTLTGLSENQSISVPDGNSYDLNITNNQPSVWTINGTDYSKRVLWTLNTTSENLTNFQVHRITPYDSDMQADMDDRQLTYYENDTLISFWDETVINSINTTGYVKVPKTSTTEQQQYWLYYSNSSMGSVSNGNNTFIQYHGATSSAYIDSPIIQNPYIIENRVRVTSATHGLKIGVSTTLAGANDAFGMETWTPNSRAIFRRNNGVGGVEDVETPAFTQNQWYTVKVVHINDSEGHVYLDESDEVGDGTITNLPVGSDMGIWFYPNSGTAESNWAFIRQYTATEPMWLTDGEEQTASGILNITALVIGDNNTQNYNTSQSREFTLTPTGTTNNVLINTTSTDYDVTVTTYWTENTTLQSEMATAGYAKQYINYIPSFNVTSADLNTIFIFDFSAQDYIGTATSILNDVSKTTIRDGQDVNASVGSLIKNNSYWWNVTVLYNNIFTLSNQSDTTAYIGISKQFNDSAYNDPDNNPILSRLWNFGDSANINTSNPTHIYNSLGVFNANYSVTEDAATDSQTITKEFNVSVEVQPIQNLSSILEQTYINFSWSDYSSADYWNVSELEKSIPYLNISIVLDGVKDSTYDCCAQGIIMYSPNPQSNTNYELILLFRNSTHLIGYAEGWDDDNLNNDDYFLIGIDGENNNLSVNDRKFILNEGGNTEAKRWSGSSWLPTSTNSIGVVSGGGVAGQISYEMIIPISEIIGFTNNATIKFYIERECSYLNPTVETFYPLDLINSTDATIWKSVILTDGEVYNYIGNTSISEFNSTGLDIFSWNKHQFITINDTIESNPIYSVNITADIQHFTVSGYIKDTLGNIVSGATVWAANGHVMEATQSDINGYYEGINFHTRNYTIYGNKSGYQENFTNVYVNGNLTNINVTMPVYTITDWEIYQQLLLIQSQNDGILLNMSINNTIINDKIDTILIFILLNMAVIVGIIMGKRGKDNDK